MPSVDMSGHESVVAKRLGVRYGTITMCVVGSLSAASIFEINRLAVKSAGAVAAVDNELASRDKSGLIGGKIQNCRCHLIRLAETTEGVE